MNSLANPCERVGSAAAIDAAVACGLPEMTPASLSRIMARFGHDGLRAGLGTAHRIHAFAEVANSKEPAAGSDRVSAHVLRHMDSWKSAFRSASAAAMADHLHRNDAWVRLRGEPGYPERLGDDVHAPAVLFGLGPVGGLGGPTVAIVGTRRSTRYGRRTAFDLGRALSDSGVLVVSGLARGIDAMAQQGALAGSLMSTAAVIGCGVDRVYPPEHRELQTAVARTGPVLAEAPLGAAPQAWRFPARNRIIAALADVVVVVESGDTGGSMHTVEEALARDRPVMAVPGPIGSLASRGCNRLIGEGAIPIVELDDVVRLVHEISRTTIRPVSPEPDGVSKSLPTTGELRPSCTCGWSAADFAPPPEVAVAHAPADRTSPARRERPDDVVTDFAMNPGPSVRAVLSDRPASLDEIAVAVGANPLDVAPVLYLLAGRGSAEEVGGWWRSTVG